MGKLSQENRYKNSGRMDFLFLVTFLRKQFECIGALTQRTLRLMHSGEKIQKKREANGRK
jgi:hypothetical protein